MLPLSWVDIDLDFESKTWRYNFKSAPTGVVRSGLEESQKTIKFIVENYPAPYTLYLSGGVDSQAMLYAWIQSGIEFKTYSAVYNQNLNSHDLVAMKQFAKIHKVDINFVNFDLINFLSTEHDFYATRYFCGSPQFTAFMKMVDCQQEGTAIMSGNFLMLDGIDKNPTYRNHPDKNASALYVYAKLSKKSFIPFFFLETQDLAYAFRVNEYVQQVYSFLQFIEYDQRPGWDRYVKNVPNFLKVSYYHSEGFPVLPQLEKLNGFEKVKEYYETNFVVDDETRKKAKLSGQRSDKVFDLMYRYPYETRLIPYRYLAYSL